MYEYFRPEITGWCTAAAVLLIQHLIVAPRPIPYWPRYVMGVTALLLGVAVLERMASRPAGLRDMILISTSGVIVVAAYGLRALYEKAMNAAEAAGEIKGRAAEANKRATGVARRRDD